MSSSTNTTAQDPVANVLAHVQSLLPSLQPSDARVARAILAEPDLVVYRTVSEVAERAETSTATVVRCAQKLGFRGFHDLKLALARELATADATAQPQRDGDPRLAALAQVAEAGSRTVGEIEALVDPAAFDACVGALAAARDVLFTGAGTSMPLAQDAAYRFSCIGLSADAPIDIHAQHVQAALLDESSVCVAISHTGSTRETLATVASASAAGATTIAITSFARSPLTQVADHVILAGTWQVSLPRTLQREVMASRLAHLAVLDALVIAVAERDEDRARRALAIYGEVLGEHRL